MFNISSKKFYELVQSIAGETEVEILEAQGINNVLSFLRAKNLYSIFDLDCEQLDDLKTRACLRLKNGDYVVRPGIKENFNYCLNFFKNSSSIQQTEQQLNVELHQQNFIEKEDTFMNIFIHNLTENMNRSKYGYEYDSQVRKFAAAVYGLGGRNVYEFLRLNLPGAFPSIPTLESYSNAYCTRIEEGQFRFEELNSYLGKMNCSFAYGSEDSTSVVSKVQYDVETNSFVGFCGSLHNGLSSIRQYQTNDFAELENWFNSVSQATLVNIHVIQAIMNNTSAPFLLSGFGTDNSYDAISIVRRWLYVYEKCYEKGIRIIGFASDADPKYLRAMRLAIGYFAQLSNINLLNRADTFHVKIPNSWTSWFYLRSRQLFVSFQDPIHVVTKLRNRLLSKTASLYMGSYRVSAKHLEKLIENLQKFDHGLVLSDLYVKDRQNYSSCLKISSQNVLNLLDENEVTIGTHCYLSILKSVNVAYIDRTTSISDRIFHAWFTVFMSRFWWTWLRFKFGNIGKSAIRRNQRPSLRTIEQHFMTFPAFYSIEINAHSFTYILLLVLNRILPCEAVNIFLFSSQPCENMFRSARSITGPSSCITNFTLQEFFSKTRKISILNEIKTLEDLSSHLNKIKFPKHHKQNKDRSMPSASTNSDDITMQQLEKTINDAFELAKSFVEKLQMSSILKRNNVFDLDNLCSNLHDDLEKLIFINDDSVLESDEDSESDDSNNEDDNGCISSEDECIDVENACTTSKKENYNGMRVYSVVAEQDKHKFFKINVNGSEKYLHKQTGAWLLTKKSNHLSADRLVRVEQTNRQ